MTSWHLVGLLLIVLLPARAQAAGASASPWQMEAGLGVAGQQGSAVPATGPALFLGLRRALGSGLGLFAGLLAAGGREGPRGMRALRGSVTADAGLTLTLRVHPSARLDLLLGPSLQLGVSRLRVVATSRSAARLHPGLAAGLGLRVALGRGELFFAGRGLVARRTWLLALVVGVAWPL